MSHASRCSDVVTYYEKYKQERKEINRQRALEYYYQNIEKRREYNKIIGKIIIMNYTQNDY